MKTHMNDTTGISQASTENPRVVSRDRYEPAPVATAAPAAGSIEGLFGSLKHECCDRRVAAGDVI